MKNICQSCDIYHLAVDQRQRQPKYYLCTDVCVTLVTYRHDVKHGSSASWLFQDLRYAWLCSKYPENLHSLVFNNNAYLIDNNLNIWNRIRNALYLFRNNSNSYIFTCLCVEFKVTIRTPIAISVAVLQTFNTPNPFWTTCDYLLFTGLTMHFALCFIAETARRMFNRIVQNSHFIHGFEFKAYEPFCVKPIFRISQQWRFTMYLAKKETWDISF